MADTYTRQSSFTDGDIIQAEHGNAEFDALVRAFHQTTGHTHDGTAAGGAPVPFIKDISQAHDLTVTATGLQGSTLKTGVTEDSDRFLVSQRGTKAYVDAEVGDLDTELRGLVTTTNTDLTNLVNQTTTTLTNNLNAHIADANSKFDLVDIETKAMTKSEFFKTSESNKRAHKGSGFLEWGTGTDVNDGIIETATVANSLNLGEDKVVMIDGVIINIPDVTTIKFPAAPDALDKKDGTGRFTNLGEAITAGGTGLTASVISRQDLVLLEVWHEKLSERNVVYPYGNVQYLSTTFDSITLGVSSAASYSNFGSWDTSTRGRGANWTSLSTADKLKFLENKDHNIYLEGDELIQVRYRIRVIRGLSNSWNLNSSGYVLPDSSNTSKAVGFQGKLNSEPQLNLRTSNLGRVHLENTGKYKLQEESVNLGVAEGGLCFAIPIALVQRRNQGAGHPLNPEGCKEVNNGSGVFNKWYNLPTRISNLSQCFNASYFRPSSGGIADSLSTNGRWNSDGKFYNAVYASDIKDLRVNSRNIPDSEVLNSEIYKAISGDVRGFESIPFTQIDSIIADSSFTGSRAFFTSDTSRYKAGEYVTLVDGNGTIVMERSRITTVVPGSHILMGNALPYDRVSGVIYYAVHESFRELLGNSQGLTWTDIIGTPANIVATASALGVDGFYGTWIPSLDFSSNLKLNRKSLVSQGTRVRTIDNGNSWDVAPVAFQNTANTLSTDNISNQVQFTHYNTRAHFTEESDNLKINLLGHVFAGNWNSNVYGNALVSSLIDKVATNSDNTKVNVTLPLTSRGTRHPSGTIDTGAFAQPVHATIDLIGSNPAVKTLSSLTEVDGYKALQFHFKEMKYDGSWGDDDKFQITDNISTLVDSNGNSVLYGTHIYKTNILA